MSCADICLSHDYDGHYNDFYVSKLVRARKPHVCCECDGGIAVGEVYEAVSGKNQGFFTARTCAVCFEVRRAFVCGSWVHGELWESVENEMFPVWQERGQWDCLAKLTTDTAIAECTRRFREWSSEEEVVDA